MLKAVDLLAKERKAENNLAMLGSLEEVRVVLGRCRGSLLIGEEKQLRCANLA